jgi:hypothetical protein
MKKTKGSAETKNRSRREPRLSNPDFRTLLDHLGRLLAQEYVALISQPEASEATPPQEDLE